MFLITLTNNITNEILQLWQRAQDILEQNKKELKKVRSQLKLKVKKKTNQP